VNLLTITKEEIMEENITSNTSEEVNEETVKVRTYTEEEVLKLLQSETDKRVAQALKTQAKKHEKELSLSKLDGSEREKAEKDNRIAELEEQLAKFEIERNKSELKSVLSARGLSAEFADDMIIIDDDLQGSQARIERLDKLFKKEVQREVERRLASNSPKGNASIQVNELTKEKAKKLSINEMNELLKNDPDKFKELFG
jgi:hypothetical protein